MCLVTGSLTAFLLLLFGARAQATAAPHTTSKPAASSIRPTVGPIAGGHLELKEASLRKVTRLLVGGHAATGLSDSDTTLRATAPNLRQGTYPLTLQMGSTMVHTALTYVTIDPPSIGSINTSPGTNRTGTTLTLKGTGLSRTTAVRFGKVAATDLKVLSDKAVSFRIPDLDTGDYRIEVVTPGGTTTYSKSVSVAPSVGNAVRTVLRQYWYFFALVALGLLLLAVQGIGAVRQNGREKRAHRLRDHWGDEQWARGRTQLFATLLRASGRQLLDVRRQDLAKHANLGLHFDHLLVTAQRAQFVTVTKYRAGKGARFANWLGNNLFRTNDPTPTEEYVCFTHDGLETVKAILDPRPGEPSDAPERLVSGAIDRVVEIYFNGAIRDVQIIESYGVGYQTSNNRN